MKYERPQVMGIVNLTPDSFYVHVEGEGIERVLAYVEQMVRERVDILDLGAESTRPGFTALTWQEEWERLEAPLRAIRAQYPEIPISIDTYHPETAELAIAAGADIINDISGGCEAMDEVLSRTRVPYILTYNENEDEDENHNKDMIAWFAERIDTLHRMQVSDIILDPGFGFGKTTDECWQVLHDMPKLKIFGLPILVGLSHKSMLRRKLGIKADEAANATTAINMRALMLGADILRVHNVKHARECVRLFEL